MRKTLTNNVKVGIGNQDSRIREAGKEANHTKWSGRIGKIYVNMQRPYDFNDFPSSQYLVSLLLHRELPRELQELLGEQETEKEEEGEGGGGRR